MSLPNGYTELEYIESTGTQYINTGVSPTKNLKTEIVITPNSSGMSEHGVLGSTWAINGYFLMFYQNMLRWHSCGASVDVSTFNKTGKNTIVCTSIGLTVNGSLYSMSGTGTDSANAVTLFGGISGYAAAVNGKFKLHSCKMYNGTTIIRNFVPCINAAGAAGLYDLVSGAFYANKGTGSFAAGSVIKHPPSAPEYFNAFGSGGAVHLYWSQDENTLGYLLYRNGELIADTAETSYTDTGAEIYSGQQYTLVPYNDDGNGISVSLNVIVKGDPRPLGDLITDRTAADVATRTRKGVYNASDLNRVAASAEYVHDILDGLGYRVPDQPNRAWFTNEIPDRGEMNAHHNAVVGLDVIRYAHEKVVLPPNLEKLTYERANNIEKFLLLCGEAAERIPEGYIYSDEIYGGELS